MTNALPKISIIGLGDHARDAHLKHLVKLDVDAVIGIHDLREDVLHVRGRGNKATGEQGQTPLDMAAAHGKELRFFANMTDAFTHADAVMICTPDEFHMANASLGIMGGKHVFCEKPLITQPGQMRYLKETLAIAREDGVTFTSCHPRRFDPPYVRLKRLLPELLQGFGPLLAVKLDFSYHKPSKTGLHGGSMLQDHANHEIDYLMFLAGTSPFKAWRLIDEEDRYHMSGVREDGIVFDFGGTRRLDTSTYPETIHLRFERGEVFVDTYNSRNSYMLDHQTRDKTPLEELGTTDYDVRFGDMNAHWLRLIAGTEDNYLSEAQMLINSYASVAFQTSHFIDTADM